MADSATHEKLPTPLPSTETAEGIREILKRGGKGDQAMLPLLKTLFDREGRGLGLVDSYGHAYAFTRDSLIRFAAGDSLTIQEALRRKIDGLRDELV